jgi:hypothetical protein
MCGGGVRPNKSPHVWSFFTGDQLVSFNLLSSAKPLLSREKLDYHFWYIIIDTDIFNN